MPMLVSGDVALGSSLAEFAHEIVARNTEYTVPAWCDVRKRRLSAAALARAV
jgi:hypothetical protein